MILVPKFKCKNSGKCCTHPNIVITLTHEDIYRLMLHLKDFSILLTKVQFMIDPVDMANLESQTVLKKVKTSLGDGIFILRRTDQNICNFFDSTTNLCSINEFRPQSCRNFPFSFSVIEENKPIIATWIKGAKNFCPGIGSGNEYKNNILKIIGKRTVKSIEVYNELIEEINKEAENNNPLTPQETLMTVYMVADRYKENFIKVQEII